MICTITAVLSLTFLPAIVDAQQSYTVGMRNLEHFHDGSKRGFPETPSQIPERTGANYETIAATIKTLDAEILVLQGINGERVMVLDEDGATFENDRSPELDRLIAILRDSHPLINCRNP